MKAALKLIAALDTQSDPVAYGVIERLAALGPAAFPDVLAAACDTGAPIARNWCLDALGYFRDDTAVPVLLAALEEDKMTVKLHTLLALQRLAPPNASAPIAKLLDDASGAIRARALTALGVVGGRIAAARVPKLLDDPKWYVRQAACRACKSLRIVRAKRRLADLAASDERKAVRTAAADAVASLRS